MRLDRGDVCHPLADRLKCVGGVQWLAQALAALDGMTPNAFTAQAEQTAAARNGPRTRIDESDGRRGSWCSWRAAVVQQKRLPCPIAACAGVEDSVDGALWRH